jgi:hypothetical protein
MDFMKAGDDITGVFWSVVRYFYVTLTFCGTKKMASLKEVFQYSRFF